MLSLFGLWAVALMLGAVSAIAAIASVAQETAPSVAAELWPANGRVLTTMADLATRRGSSDLASPTLAPVDAQWVDVSRRAYSVEPTSAAALRTLGLNEQAHGHRDRARRLMRSAASLTKRDLLVNYWLVDDYGRSGQIDAALNVYDQMLRTLDEARGPVLGLLASALSNPDVVVPMYRLLRGRPPWAAAFWNLAAQRPASLANAARLRVMLARAGVGAPPDKDAILLNALVERGLFDVGRDVYAAVSTERSAPLTLVSNGDFSHASVLAPYDWRLTSSGELGAGIDPRAGVLEISALSGSRGEVARQLIRLEPARYSLQTIYTVEGRRNGSLRFKLTCAERGNRASVHPSPAPGRSSTVIDLSSQGCRHYWMVVAVEVPEQSAGLDAALDRIQLTQL